MNFYRGSDKIEFEVDFDEPDINTIRTVAAARVSARLAIGAAPEAGDLFLLENDTARVAFAPNGGYLLAQVLQAYADDTPRFMKTIRETHGKDLIALAANDRSATANTAAELAQRLKVEYADAQASYISIPDPDLWLQSIIES